MRFGSKMQASLRLAFRQYLRTPLFWIAQLLLMIASALLLKREVGYPCLPLTFVTATLKLGLIAFVFYLITSYEFTASLRRSSAEEAVQAHKNAEAQLLLAQTTILLAGLLLWVAELFEAQWLHQSDLLTEQPLFLRQTYLGLLLYCGLPGLSGILLGAALRRRSRPTVFAAAILLALSVGPALLELFSHILLPDQFPVAKLLDWFSLYVPNSNWYPDGLYGIGLERPRWVLAGLWCCFPLGLILRGCRRSGKGIRAASWIFAGLTVVLGIIFAFGGSEYVLRKDDRTDGSLNVDNQYYTAAAVTGDVPASFTVSSCELRLSISGCLEAEADLTIADGAQQTFCFTLHHGYEVRSVSDGANSLPFEREGDLLTIHGSETGRLVIAYRGNAGKYYANRQAVLLPGYLAWYPIPGQWQLWDLAAASIRTDRPVQSMDFRVSVVCADYPIYSNLPQTATNEYAGTAETVTLMGGMVTSEQQDGLTFCYTPVMDYTLDFKPEEVEACWKKLAVMLQLPDELSVTGKTVFLLPSTVNAQYAVNESAVLYNDHILLANGGNPDPELFCQMLVVQRIPSEKKSSELYYCFFNNLIGNAYAAPEKKPEQNELSLMFQYDSANEIEDPEVWSEYLLQANSTFEELFAWQIQSLGKEPVMRAVYGWLTDPGDKTNQAEFLYHVEVEHP